MEHIAIPKEEPSVIYPIGAVVEDCQAIYKILAFQKQNHLHKYKVQVLQRKEAVPTHVKQYLDDSKPQWLLVLPQNINKMKRIE